jgi:eukaryotic-like serine/threonine-protein kinase
MNSMRVRKRGEAALAAAHLTQQIASITILMADPIAALASKLRDRYTLERELGRGGMATVFLARDLKHDRPVALKVLHADLAASLGAERFLAEIRTAARLQHPHILSVHDSGEANGLLWFTMPYVEGESLRARLARDKQLPLEDALRVVTEVADALEYAHQHGVIHRDIKPENILLGGGHALVADFGVARALADADGSSRLTESGIVVGTPQYMSPEQAAGDRELGPRTDIYSLGCVLYEMLAGEPPYTGATAQAILAKRLREPVPSVATLRQVPVPVELAVSRALARTPADRFSSAAQFARALHQITLPGTQTIRTVRISRNVLRATALMGGLLLLVGGYLAVSRFSTTPADNMNGSPGAGPEGIASAAVLPFTDMSATKDQEYFSDGLTEELITSLSQVPGLRVAARTSSFQFKAANADVREVGRKLAVGSVLEGSVRRSGDRLRVSAQLVSAKDGYQLWSESYDRSVADVFAVQEDIARAIVSALRVRLVGGADSTLATHPTTDLVAYDLYLKGRFAWNQRTEASIPEAAQYFEQATKRDPNFARAYAGLSDANLLLPSYASVSPAIAWPRARAAATRALALDSTLAEAYTSLAYGTMLYEWDWNRAEELFRRAIEEDSSYATAHHWYADYLAGRGRLDEALHEMRRAAELDPLSRIIGNEVGWILCLMHRPDEALVQGESMRRLDPNFAHTYFILGLAQIQKGQGREAVVSLQRAIDLSGFYSHISAALARAYAVAGDTAAAVDVLRDMERRSTNQYVAPFAFAVAHTALGHKTEAFKWLHKGIDQRDLFLPENFFDPLLDPLRSDPRYVEILPRMGLARSRSSASP